MAGSRFSYVDDEIERLRRESLYRTLTYGRTSGPHITVSGTTLLNLCSNDYLGIRSSEMIPSRMQSSARLVSGNDEVYRAAEDRLSELKSMPASLIYPTGYMANLGVVAAVAGSGDLILSDRLNHTSIIQAIKLSGAKVSVYGHNDTEDLERRIREGARRRFVVTEGIFSMDGDYARLKEIAEIVQKAGAILVLDDAHADFAVGSGGAASLLGADVDIITSSLSKALGSFGGYVASRQNVVDLCINRSKTFMFTSALPAGIVEHALDRLNMDLEPHRSRLARNVRHLAGGLEQMGLVSGPQSHIIPVLVGDAARATEVAGFLRDRGIFAQPIRYPTVPQDEARIRLSVTAWLERDHIESALEALESAATRFGLATCSRQARQT